MMSSSKPAHTNVYGGTTATGAAPAAGNSGVYSGPGYTYNIGAGAGIGSVTISADEIKALTGAVVDTPSKMLLSVESGEPNIAFYEMDGSQRIKATFEPDSCMSVGELARVLQLTFVLRESGTAYSLKPISYIRRHNLERHFRFSTV